MRLPIRNLIRYLYERKAHCFLILHGFVISATRTGNVRKPCARARGKKNREETLMANRTARGYAEIDRDDRKFHCVRYYGIYYYYYYRSR